MGKNNLQVATRTPSHTRLFDPGVRTHADIAGRDETRFAFMNRSAWESIKRARKTLQRWYSAFPDEKQKDIWSRFRSDDGQHLGALLELATHQLLLSICAGVQVDPDFNNLTPDFAATYEGVDFVVECTVAQESDREIGATKRAEIIKNAIDSVDTGRFRLSCELLSNGPDQPSTKELCLSVKNWVDSLDPDEEIRKRGQGYGPSELSWRKNGWDLQLEVIHVASRNDKEVEKRAIHMEIDDGGWRQDDESLKRALKKKARKYRDLELPFLVVFGSGNAYADPQGLFEALFGHEILVASVQSKGTEPTLQPGHKYDGLFGSPSALRSQQLSAVLFKPRLGLFTLCGEDDPWLLIHNPWAQYPLPPGIFPFAIEFVSRSGKPSVVEPTIAINDVLGLPVPWPGNER